MSSRASSTVTRTVASMSFCRGPTPPKGSIGALTRANFGSASPFLNAMREFVVVLTLTLGLMQPAWAYDCAPETRETVLGWDDATRWERSFGGSASVIDATTLDVCGLPVRLFGIA